MLANLKIASCQFVIDSVANVAGEEGPSKKKRGRTFSPNSLWTKKKTKKKHGNTKINKSRWRRLRKNGGFREGRILSVWPRWPHNEDRAGMIRVVHKLESSSWFAKEGVIQEVIPLSILGNLRRQCLVACLCVRFVLDDVTRFVGDCMQSLLGQERMA